MKRLLLASAVLLEALLAFGCGGSSDSALKIVGLLFLTGVIGKRGVSTAEDAVPMGRARIEIRDGRGSATLHLERTTRADVPGLDLHGADVRVTGAASADGTFDLSGRLPDGTLVRIAGRNLVGRSGETVSLTVGARTTEHTSVAP